MKIESKYETSLFLRTTSRRRGCVPEKCHNLLTIGRATQRLARYVVLLEEENIVYFELFSSDLSGTYSEMKTVLRYHILLRLKSFARNPAVQIVSNLFIFCTISLISCSVILVSVLNTYYDMLLNNTIER